MDDRFNGLANQMSYEPKNEHAFRFLYILSTDELKVYMKDDDALDVIIQNVKEVQDLEAKKKLMIATNCSLAESNLGKESVMKTKRREIQKLCKDAEELFKNVESKSAKMSQRGLETTLTLLQAAAAEMEEESEELVSKFLKNSLDLEEFLEQFSSRRKLMHLRKLNAEKMTEMVQKRIAL